MARDIDERIVAMYFDNDQFEKGARQSLKTLEELKEGLDFENVGESFEQVSKITSKGFGLKDQTRQVSLFSRAITSMGKVAKGAFNVATMPLQGLYNGFKSLEGYVGKVLGFDLASKLVNAGETVIRAFTIDPMKTGWNEYELKMDSVKTIMTGTMEEFKRVMGEDYTEEAHLNAVKTSLEELNKYADDTIYSFQDMTSNIGKFTNNGVKLEDAVMAMKGISNAAAQAGQGTQQASMAMYNLSQAISVGKLTTMDWKSIENANMATQQFKQTFIDMAAAMGKLEKKGDKYYTKTKKHMEVTAENFRNTLNEGWADTDVITAALKVFSGDYLAVDLVGLGVPEELALQMEQLGQQAKEAATQVRTFSKMWDALKEAAQSGWAMSWEYIFGDVNEATQLWTGINDKVSSWLNSSSEARNNLLKGWRGLIQDKDVESLQTVLEQYSGIDWKQYKNLKWMKDGEGVKNVLEEILYNFEKFGTGDKAVQELIEYLKNEYDLKSSDAREAVDAVLNAYQGLDYVGKDGRQALIDGVTNLLDGFELVGKYFGNIKKAVFGEMTPAGLQALSNGFKNLTGQFVEWAKALDKGATFQQITNGLKGVVAIVKALWTSVKRIGSLALSIISPVGEFFTKTFGKVGEWFNKTFASGGISDGLKKIREGFKNLTKVKVVGWFKGIGKSFGDLFKNIGGKTTNWLNNNGFSGIAKFLTDSWNSISNAWKTVSGWSGWSAIGSFLGNTYSWIVGLFRPQKSDDGEEGPSAIGGFINEAWESIKAAWETSKIVFKSVADAVGGFFVNTWSSIISLFKTGGGEEGQAEDKEGPSKIGKFIDDAWLAIQAAWETAKETFASVINAVGNFFKNTWSSIVSLFESDGEADSSKEESGPSEIGSVITEAWQSIKQAWESAKKTFSNVISAVGAFFKNTWSAIVAIYESQKNGNDSPKASENGPSNFETIVTEAWQGIEKAWNAAKITFSNVINAIGNFFKNTWSAIVAMFEENGSSADTPANSEDGPSGIGKFINEAWTVIQGVWDKAKEDFGDLINALGNFFKNTWAAIVLLFEDNGGTEETPKEGENGPSNFKTILESAWGKIVEAWNSTKTAFGSVAKDIGEFLLNTWNWLVNAVLPSANAEESVSDIGEAVASAVPEISEEEVKNAETKLSLFEKLTTTISNFVTSVKDWNGWSDISKFFSTLFDGVSSVYKSLTGENDLERIWNIITDTFHIILDILESVTSFAKKVFDSDAEGHVWAVVNAVIGILTVLGTKLGYAYLSSKVGQVDSLGSQFLKLSAGIALLAVGVAILGSLNIATLAKGVGAVVVLGLVISGILVLRKKLEEAKPDANPITAWERFGNGIVKWIGIIMSIKTVLDLLPKVIESFKNSDATGEDVLKVLEGVTVLIGSFTMITGALAALKVGGTQIASAALGVAVAIPILVTGLFAAFEALGGLVGLLDGLGSVDYAIEKLAGLWNKLKEAFGPKQLTGDELANTGDALSEAVTHFDDIDDNSVDKMKRVMDTIKYISENLPDNPSDFQAFFTGATQFEDLPRYFGLLAGAAIGFAQQAEKVTDDQFVAADRLAEFFRKMLVVANLSQFLASLSDKSAGLNFLAFLQQISDVGEYKLASGYDENLKEAVESAASFAEFINSAIESAVPEINVDPLIEAIYNGLVSDESKATIMSAFQELGKNASDNGISLSSGSDIFGMLGGLFGASGNAPGMDAMSMFGVDSTSDDPFGIQALLNKYSGDNSIDFFGSIFGNNIGEDGEFDFMSSLGIDPTSDDPFGIRSMLDKYNTEDGGLSIPLSLSPVMDDSSLPDWWSGSAAMEIKGEVSIDSASLTTITNGLTSLENTAINQTNRIVSEIGSLNDRIGGLESAINNIQIVLDTGAIASAVDQKLGARMALQDRVAYA